MEEEEAIEQGKILESDFKITKNGVFKGTITLLDGSLSERNNTDIEDNKADNWEDKPEENEPIFKA